MSAVHKKRIFVVSFVVGGLSLATGLILFALSKNIDLYYTPTQVKEQAVPSHKTIRVGGMVVKDTVKRENDLRIAFTVTDYQHEMVIHYQGILPDLFREGQGIVALGQMDDTGTFHASQVLAKHDEKYMPPEVAATLKSKI